MTRYATNKILAMIEDGTLSADSVALAALKYMSEDDVADMAHVNGFLDDEDSDEDSDEGDE